MHFRYRNRVTRFAVHRLVFLFCLRCRTLEQKTDNEQYLAAIGRFRRHVSDLRRLTVHVDRSEHRHEVGVVCFGGNILRYHRLLNNRWIWFLKVTIFIFFLNWFFCRCGSVYFNVSNWDTFGTVFSPEIVYC